MNSNERAKIFAAGIIVGLMLCNLLLLFMHNMGWGIFRYLPQ